MVAQLPWLDEMRDGKQGAEHDTDAADDDVGDAQEGVLAAHDGARADYDGLCAAVFGHWEIWGCVREVQVRRWERRWDTHDRLCRLSSVLQSCCAYRCAGSVC